MTATQLHLFPAEPRVAELASDYLSDLAETEEPAECTYCAYLMCDEPVVGTIPSALAPLPVCDRHRPRHLQRLG